MFVAVINRSHIIERVFTSINQKVCENWAKEEAQKIFGRNIDSISVGEILNKEGTDIYISVLESERF